MNPKTFFNFQKTFDEIAFFCLLFTSAEAGQKASFSACKKALYKLCIFTQALYLYTSFLSLYKVCIFIQARIKCKQKKQTVNSRGRNNSKSMQEKIKRVKNYLFGNSPRHR